MFDYDICSISVHVKLILSLITSNTYTPNQFMMYPATRWSNFMIHQVKNGTTQWCLGKNETNCVCKHEKERMYEQMVIFDNNQLTINIVLESQHRFQLSRGCDQTVLINCHPQSQPSNYHPTLPGVCYPWSTWVLPKRKKTHLKEYSMENNMQESIVVVGSWSL